MPAHFFSTYSRSFHTTAATDQHLSWSDLIKDTHTSAASKVKPQANRNEVKEHSKKTFYVTGVTKLMVTLSHQKALFCILGSHSDWSQCGEVSSFPGFYLNLCPKQTLL